MTLSPKDADNVILLVSEDDGSDTYYRISMQHGCLLARIHDKRFVCNVSRITDSAVDRTEFDPVADITSSDNSVYMDEDLSKFISKFRGGRYTQEWSDIASQLCVLDATNRDRCLPYDYSVFLYH